MIPPTMVFVNLFTYFKIKLTIPKLTFFPHLKSVLIKKYVVKHYKVEQKFHITLNLCIHGNNTLKVGEN